MSKIAVPAVGEALNRYEKLIAANPKVERKGGTLPYTSVNGHMFSFLTKMGRLALRLPEPERDAFLKKYKSKLCEQHGAVLKEYVEVPGSLLTKTQELKKFFDISYVYVAALKRSRRKRRRNHEASERSDDATGLCCGCSVAVSVPWSLSSTLGVVPQ